MKIKENGAVPECPTEDSEAECARMKPEKQIGCAIQEISYRFEFRATSPKHGLGSERTRKDTWSANGDLMEGYHLQVDIGVQSRVARVVVGEEVRAGREV